MALAAVSKRATCRRCAGLWTGSDLLDLQNIGIKSNAEGLRAMRQRLEDMIELPANAPVDQVIAATHTLLGAAGSKFVAQRLTTRWALPSGRTCRARPTPGRTRRGMPKPLEELEQDALALEVARRLTAARPTAT